MAGMTENGFVPKKASEIMQDINLELQDLEDENTGERPFINVEQDTVLQQVLALFANELEQCWNAAYAAYAQFDPQKNTGAGQSGTVQLNGLVRHPGTAAQITVTLTGRPGVIVPAGTIFSDAQGDLQFALDASVTLSGTGSTVTATGTATATQVGTVDLEIGQISTVQTAVAGLFSVSNTVTNNAGTDQETDAELRIRQQRSTSGTSYRQIEAIYSAVAAVDGVTYCRVYQNAETYPEDDRGIPYKEIAVVVEGGDNTAIAEAMFLRMPIGVMGHGDTFVSLYDNQGISYPIAFSRPQQVPVSVDIQLRETEEASVIPATYMDDIKAAICNYAQYGLDSNTGFPPGSDVIRTQLYTPINETPGFEIVSVKLKGGNLSTFKEANVIIDWNEVAIFDPDTINIEVVD